MTFFDRLPDGTLFPFWDDQTVYARTLHVAQDNDAAADGNSGTVDAPFKTIGAASRVVQPGEKVMIHAGVYHETVCLQRGGTGPDRMIAFEAAPNERVVITATEEFLPAAKPSAGWHIPAIEGKVTVWMADLPETAFVAYNPFLARNAYEYLFHFGDRQDPDWMKRALLRRGRVWFRGEPLKQVSFPCDLASQAGVFWVEEPGLRIHFRLPGDVAPVEPLEITVREQTFAPREMGLGFIRVAGLVLQNAADGLPIPQRGSLSTCRGHHWIIENCTVDGANGVGISLGAESWDATETEGMGYHIVRRNQIVNCGVCGIAGSRGVKSSLFENNRIEFIGYLDLERMYECAGIKFHFAENCLIRDNLFRNLKHAGGIWLDVDNVNNRISGNVFVNIETVTAAIYSEMNFERNLIDHNVIWDIRGTGIHADCNECVVIAHNLIGEIPEGGAILCSLGQAKRKSNGRTALCRANQVLNNIVFRCPRRIEFGRREQNVSNGNLFDSSNDNCGFHIAYPEPGNYQKLVTWQSFFGLDEDSRQVNMAATFSADTLQLQFHHEGDGPDCVKSDLLGGGLTHVEPGPFTADQWHSLGNGDGICFK